MYCQILVTPEERLLTHSLASFSQRLNTTTYDLSCAPFLAIRTLRQLNDDENARFSRGFAALRHDCYVDDIVTGAYIKEEAIAIQSELIIQAMAIV